MSSDKGPSGNFKTRLWLAVGAAILVLIAVAIQFGWQRMGRGSVVRSHVVSYTLGKLVTGGVNGWIGLKITTGDRPVVVTELGRYTISGNERAHTLKFVIAATRADLPGGSVELLLAGKPPGRINYAPLPAPVTLAPNTSYYLLSSESLGLNVGDFFHDFDTKLETTPVAQVDHAVFFSGTEWRNLGSQNQALGPLSFRYTE